jgi:hypothetical protein
MEEGDMASGSGCPHEVDDKCTRFNNPPCDPGMWCCTLVGRFVFDNTHKNIYLREKQARAGDGK